MARVAIPIAALVCLGPWLDAGEALLLGVTLAISIGNPYAPVMKAWTHRLLAAAIVGLGFGTNLGVIGRVGLHGVGYTVVGIAVTLCLGVFLGRRFGVKENTTWLVAVGTAICGGSAIAALAPVLRAKDDETSVALGTVFLLNAAALFVFPFVGHAVGLDEARFGLWSALAIHDTSSVVGASLRYGAQAVKVATTVKLARALWIVPVAFGVGSWRTRGETSTVGQVKAKRPWFILGFLAAAALVTWVPSLAAAGHVIEHLAKRIMILTLFAIGAGLTRATLKSVGAKPFALGFVLWVVIASGSLSVINAGWITP